MLFSLELVLQPQSVVGHSVPVPYEWFLKKKKSKPKEKSAQRSLVTVVKLCSENATSSISISLCLRGPSWLCPRVMESCAIRSESGWDGTEGIFPKACVTVGYFRVISSTDAWLLAAARTCGVWGGNHNASAFACHSNSWFAFVW